MVTVRLSPLAECPTCGADIWQNTLHICDSNQEPMTISKTAKEIAKDYLGDTIEAERLELEILRHMEHHISDTMRRVGVCDHEWRGHRETTGGLARKCSKCGLIQTDW